MKMYLFSLILALLFIPLAAYAQHEEHAPSKGSCCRPEGKMDSAGCAEKTVSDVKVASETKMVSLIPVNTKGIQEVTVVVKDGYTPSTIRVKKGTPVRMNFDLQEKSCTGTVIFKQLQITQKLSYGNVTPVLFTPDSVGTFSFACPMAMTTGTVVVVEK